MCMRRRCEKDAKTTRYPIILGFMIWQNKKILKKCLLTIQLLEVVLRTMGKSCPHLTGLCMHLLMH